MARDPKGGRKRSGNSTPESSFEADRLKFLIDKSPIAQSVGKSKVELPEVVAPSLEGLEVKVPAAKTLTTQEVLDRLEGLIRLVAESRLRVAGERVAWGDEICVDLLGYLDGHLIPFSAREEEWFYVEPHPFLPGLFEALVGKVIPSDRLQVDVVLPVTYPVERARGSRVTFFVDVRAGAELILPDLKNEGFIAKLGKGSTIDVVMKTIVADLEKERVNETFVRAQNLVLDEVARRATFDVPQALVDEEIRTKWLAAESPLLIRKALKPAQLTEALEGWLTDPATRADAERRLRISLTLRAIAERDQIKPDPAKMKQLVASAGKIFGVEIDNLGDALTSDPEAAEQFFKIAVHVATVEHVMKKAKVHFDAPSPR